MGVGPVPSTEKALAKAGLSIDDIGAIEINEAFAVQVLAFLDHFGVDAEDPRVNPYGGRDRARPPAGQLRGAADDPPGARVPRPPRGPLRPDHDVHRARHGRHRRLGEPGVRGAAARGATGVSAVLDGAELAALIEQTAAGAPDEVVTHALSRDVVLPHGAGTGVLDHPRQRPGPPPAEHLRRARAGRAERRPRRRPGPRRRGRGRGHRQAVHPGRRGRPQRDPADDRPGAGAGDRPDRARRVRPAAHRRRADVRLRQRSRARRRLRAGPARARTGPSRRRGGPGPARVLPRPRAGLGRLLPAAEPDRRRARA